MISNEEILDGIGENCKLLWDGYFEDVEYEVSFLYHNPSCPDNGSCKCPMVSERRSRRVKRPGYLDQLREFAKYKDVDRNPKAVRSGPRVKTAGKPPGDLEGFFALDQLEHKINDLRSKINDLRSRSTIMDQDQRSSFKINDHGSKIKDLHQDRRSSGQDQGSSSRSTITGKIKNEDRRSWKVARSTILEGDLDGKINDHRQDRRSSSRSTITGKINDLDAGPSLDQLECMIPNGVDKILDQAGKDRTWAVMPVKSILMGLKSLTASIITDHPEVALKVLAETNHWVDTARAVLKISVADSMFGGTVCGTCGGGLAIAADNSTEVRCVGSPDAPPCGVSYGPSDWLNLLKAQTATGAAHDA